MDTFEHAGHTFEIELVHDESADAPWENDCIFEGVVSDWTRAKKAPYQRVLHEDRGSRHYFDVRQYIKVAVGHGCTRKQAAEQLEQSFEYLRRWCNDQWHYVGVVVHLLDEEGERTDLNDALWGIESDQRGYITTTARDLADDILRVNSERIAELEAVYAGL